MSHQSVITELTDAIRNSDRSFAAGIRRCLKEKGISVETAIIADLFPDDHCLDFGLVVTGEGAVFQFGYRYPANQEQRGKFTEWTELTGTWERSPYSEQVNVAQSMRAEGVWQGA